MLIDALSAAIEENGALSEVYAKLDAGQDAALAVAASARPFVVAARFAAKPQPMLVVLPGEDAVEGFARSVAAYLGDERVAAFPARADRSLRAQGGRRAFHRPQDKRRMGRSIGRP